MKVATYAHVRQKCYHLYFCSIVVNQKQELILQSPCGSQTMFYWKEIWISFKISKLLFLFKPKISFLRHCTVRLVWGNSTFMLPCALADTPNAQLLRDKGKQRAWIWTQGHWWTHVKKIGALFQRELDEVGEISGILLAISRIYKMPSSLTIWKSQPLAKEPAHSMLKWFLGTLIRHWSTEVHK